jgi:hypothetical protein
VKLRGFTLPNSPEITDEGPDLPTERLEKCPLWCAAVTLLVFPSPYRTFVRVTG